ncbi:hypothetical protein B0J13DRAFT_659459 [Dactylonectria estremocensis]|uniref:Uncharacterized protein n=1 Tax=Dactylonectria estremocensis TaxID=1079267 RepID=A0A9P9I9X7_9HYPO|nr:hypothetical protein B0J13DRAFT_659459 [Dactylonectria estremocensis]
MGSRLARSSIPRGENGGWHLANENRTTEGGDSIGVDEYEEMAQAAFMLQAIGQGFEAPLFVPSVLCDIFMGTDDEDPTIGAEDDVTLKAQDRHKDFQTRTKNVRNWVLETIDEPLSRHHCKPETTLPEWIQSIYDEFALATEQRKQRARRTYRDILGEPLQGKIKTNAAAAEWLIRWRNAINEAQDVGLHEAKEPDQWLGDLTALQSTHLQAWTDAYSVMQIGQVRAGTLTVGPVMADIRREIAKRPEVPRRGRIAPGAFHNGGGTQEGANNSPNTPQKNNKKRNRQSIGGDKEAKCPACRQLHPLFRCFCAFPENKPDWFIYRPHVQARFNRLLEENEDDLVGRIRKIKLEKSA